MSLDFPLPQLCASLSSLPQRGSLFAKIKNIFYSCNYKYLSEALQNPSRLNRRELALRCVIDNQYIISTCQRHVPTFSADNLWLDGEDEEGDVGDVAGCEDEAFGAGDGAFFEEPAKKPEKERGSGECQQIEIANAVECQRMYGG